jgi:hypothetical protein
MFGDASPARTFGADVSRAWRLGPAAILESYGDTFKRVLDERTFPKQNLTQANILCRNTGVTLMIHPPDPSLGYQPPLLVICLRFSGGPGS